MERGEASSKNFIMPSRKVMCACGLPAKIFQSWTDKNPGRRFLGCERFKRGGECKFFQWYDKEEPYGWQMNALIEARDEIREKNKTIEELKNTINKLSTELQRKTEEEKIIENFLKL